ncbi:MAG: mechanosensitive ion channel family protein [Cyanothece sp. SIO2G6]|nr:mechanosensitive ion channel family protein [Cyanothece sp. SIO2G6]
MRILRHRFIPKFVRRILITAVVIPKFVRRILITAVVIVAVGGRVLVEAPPALGQFVLPSTPVLSSSYPPANVERFGEIETAPVRSPFFGKDLFRVAAPTVYVRDGEYQDGNVPVELRAELIEANLRRAMTRLTDVETVRVNRSILNGNLVLQVSDQDLSRPINLLTVTALDASFYAQTDEEVAKNWQQHLQAEFEGVLEARAKFGDQILGASPILFGMVVLFSLLQVLHWLLRRHNRALKQQVAEQEMVMQQTEEAVTTAALSIDPEPDPTLPQPSESPTDSEPSPPTGPIPEESSVPLTPAPTATPTAEPSSTRMVEEQLPERRSRFIKILGSQLSLRRERRINRFLRWLIFWAEVAVVYFGTIWITSSVTQWHRARAWLLGLPIHILLVAFGTSLTIRVSHWLIHQLADSYQDYSFLTLGESERRRLLRITTISGVLEGIATAFWVTIGIIFILESLSVPTQSILAGGAVVAFAISFGSQSLVKDIITGCFILIEDQYAVGDVVGIGEVTGLVETLNLRVTQLRDAEGQLITIPNSSISQVKNLTRLWSRVDFTVTVAYDTDPTQLLALLQSVGADLYAEPEWAEKIVEPPTVMGIDHLSHEGMLVRVWIKTKPLQQWATGREFRYRVRQAFEQQGIQIGKPQWILTQPDYDRPDHNRPDHNRPDYDKYPKESPWL